MRRKYSAKGSTGCRLPGGNSGILVLAMAKQHDLNEEPARNRDKQEIEQRRDDGLRRLLKLPPKRHDEIIGKTKRKPTKKPKH